MPVPKLGAIRSGCDRGDIHDDLTRVQADWQEQRAYNYIMQHLYCTLFYLLFSCKTSTGRNPSEFCVRETELNWQ